MLSSTGTYPGVVRASPVRNFFQLVLSPLVTDRIDAAVPFTVQWLRDGVGTG